jgi:hypothetical protein
MLVVRNDKIYWKEKQVGYIIGNRIFDNSTKLLCTVSEDTQSIYNASNEKIIQIKGHSVIDATTGRTIDLDDSVQSITAVGFSNIFHIAISIFFGE